MQKFLIILLFLAGTFLARSQDTVPSFRDIDLASYELYQAKEWGELIRYNNWALKEGYDYYYLRMRSAIAWYVKKNYMQAARHFEEALNFNAGDPVALDYLFGCYLELNQTADAMRIFRQKKGLETLRPRLLKVDFSAGSVFSDQPDRFAHLDLDGSYDIYGEADLLTGGYNINAGLSYIFRNGSRLYGGYTMLKLNKNKLVRIADTLAVDDQYVLRQHQFYLGGSIPVTKNLRINPAVNFIHDRFNPVMPEYHEGTGTYSFPVDSVKTNAFIGFLSVTRDFHVVQTSLFAAWSNLNDREQFQAGFHLLAYPFGNMNFYLSSKLMNHRNEGYNHIIFEQMAGVRLVKPLWAELNATIGDMRNYHEANGFVVYNLADRMKFKGGGRLICTLTPRWMVTAEYIYLLREGNYIVYMPLSTENGESVVPVTMNQYFNNQLIVLTLSLKI